MTSGRLIDAIDARFGDPRAPRKVGVAVSGGSDSLALLRLLAEWGRADHLAAATVDHGLRPEAADEARAVAEICDDLGIPHEILTWGAWDGRGNLQDQARRTRYSLLAGWARRAGVETVAIGHTLDDDAETFLMRVAREAGLDGLSGMAPVFWRHEMRFDRPLLTERREDLRAYLSDKGIRWIDDPSNEDTGFTRVNARAALKALEPIGITAEEIGGVITNLSLARMALDEHIRTIAARVVREASGDLIFDRSELMRQSPEVIRKLLASALRWVSGEEYPPRRDALSELEAAIYAGRTGTLHGCLVATTDMTIRVAREPAAAARSSGATSEIWDGRWRIDGPHAPGLEVRALGDAIVDTPWRDMKMPRRSLLASPAIWEGDRLVAAPVAGLENGWRAFATGRGTFAAFLLSR